MLPIYTYHIKKPDTALLQRPAQNNAAVLQAAQEIINHVKASGDKALKEYAQKFDHVELKNIKATATEIKAAEKAISPALIKALLQAKKNIATFHTPQKEAVKKITISPGITCWREARLIEKIGLYIPGGSAPLFSTVLMLGIPAMLAGCKEIILCTPCDKHGHIHPAVLYAASLCGITKIFKTGGAQAIAAMAYGTETIPAVHKIFGPGNSYVTAAKQLVQSEVAIDMPAGPSEVLVIADDTAVPAFVAADLLAQAEHGPDSQVILICTSKKIATAVQGHIAAQLTALPRQEIVKQALQHSKILLVKNITEAITVCNQYAPEHLILSCRVGAGLLAGIQNAGSVFVGNYSPESAGDYASGTNHTLPTYGYAAMYSGVSLDSFYKKITFQKLNKKGLQSLADTITTMAEAEGLQAHGNAVKIRLEK